jgi:hypothetical protein
MSLGISGSMTLMLSPQPIAAGPVQPVPSPTSVNRYYGEPVLVSWPFLLSLFHRIPLALPHIGITKPTRFATPRETWVVVFSAKRSGAWSGGGAVDLREADQ